MWGDRGQNDLFFVLSLPTERAELARARAARCAALRVSARTAGGPLAERGDGAARWWGLRWPPVGALCLGAGVGDWARRIGLSLWKALEERTRARPRQCRHI